MTQYHLFVALVLCWASSCWVSSLSLARPTKLSYRPAAASFQTSLFLFGGKKETPNKGANTPSNNNPMGGMMDQLAMFKKAQELAKKKQDLDKELMSMDIVGVSDMEGNIKVSIKYVPAQLPMNPTPGYDAVNVQIKDEYFNKVSAEELGEALVVAIRDGETRANLAVAEKYKILEAELGSLMGGAMQQK